MIIVSCEFSPSCMGLLFTEQNLNMDWIRGEWSGVDLFKVDFKAHEPGTPPQCLMIDEKQFYKNGYK